MHELPVSVVEELTLSKGASDEAIHILTSFVANEYGTSLPTDYIEFLRISNGAVGHGPDLFVILDPAESVPSTTEGYSAQEFAPGLLVFGSDGCGNLLGIDMRGGLSRDGRYVWVDGSGISWEEIMYGASCLAGLLQYLQMYYRQSSNG